METSIDSAGRVVIPKPLRVAVGLVPGPVRIEVDGAGIRIEPVADESLVERDGLWVIPSGGVPITDETVRRLLDEDRSPT